MKYAKEIVGGLLVLLLPAIVLAQSMTSTNYTIISSDFLPGTYSTSTSYEIFDGIGSLGTSISTSTNYGVYGGFTGSLFGIGTLSATLSASSLAFGQLSADSVATGAITITITTDAASGYTVKMSEASEFASGANTISDVSDGSVTAGSSEYGIRTTGAAGQYNATDTSITSSLKTIATSAVAATAQETTVTFKAAISSSVPEGDYAHVVSFATVANF